MGTFWNSLTCALHHLTLLLLFHQVLSGDCELIHHGAVLNCSNLSEFPNGSLYQDVETLNFHNNNFTELTPYVFKNHSFHHLQIIIIRQNNISHIHPHAFADMSSIRELDLYGNNLTYLHESAFVGLKGLKYLDLGHNKLVLVEGATFKPLQSLETLDLSYNNIKAVTPYLLEHTNVSELYLSGNEFEFAHNGHILESKSLTVLTLQSCKLKNLDENLFRLLPNLKYLDISYNQLKFIPEDLLKPLKQLEQLDISNNLIANLNINMFPLPSKLEVLLCDENLLECENIVEELQIIKETTLPYAVDRKESEKKITGNLQKRDLFKDSEATTKITKPKLKNSVTMAPQRRGVEIKQISTIRIPISTAKSQHEVFRPTLDIVELPSSEEEKDRELEKYLYIGLYSLCGTLTVLFIIILIEIYLLRIKRRNKLDLMHV